MDKKSSWFLGIFIILVTITIILFFKINKSSEGTSLSYEDRQFALKQAGINAEKFSFLNKVNNDLSIENNQLENERLFLEPIKSTPLNLLFLGDTMLDRHVAERLEGKHISFLLSGFSEEENFWAGYDFVGTNLEGAVTNDGEHYAPHNSYDFAFAPTRIAELKEYNFSYLALANNHFNDQGEKGVLETRANLSNLGFNYSGAVDAKIEEESRTDLEIKGIKLALISLSMVADHFSLTDAKTMIEKADLESDLVIVNIHWGSEYEHYFNRYQSERGYALIDSGADIIIGHHPHVVQGMEIYNNKPIFYSLGNFIFDQYFSEATQEGLAIDLEYQAGELVINFLPYNSSQSAPKLLSDTDKTDFLNKYITWSDLDEDLKDQVAGGYLKLSF